MRSGKRNGVLKHLLIIDHLGPDGTPFYSKIVYSSSVVENDEIYSIFKKALKKLIVQIPLSNLTQFLKEYLIVKKKYYVVYKFKINDFKVLNDTMNKIINKRQHYLFKSSRSSRFNNTNTNRPAIHLNLVNSVNNQRDDPRADIGLYALKKVQKCS
jgi:hypothetical protein